MAFFSIETRGASRTLTRKLGKYTVPALGLLLAASANGAIVESLTTTSSYTYDFVPGLPGTNSGIGDMGVFHQLGATPGQATVIDINYGAITASDASFFFLHNIQCKGYCSVGVTTWIVDTVTNTGPDTVNLSFESGITAGHLGLVQNAPTGTSGIFDFDVTQMTNGIGHQLYQAIGGISKNGAVITTSDGSTFNGLSGYQDPAQIGLDWDKTDLSLLLDPLAPGQTTTITYRSVTYLNSYGFCLDVTRCDGVQVAFGDPRNNGGIIGLAGSLSTLQSSSTHPVGWVLDRGFDLATIAMHVAPLSAVPEPGSWALMIMGFGMTGLTARSAARRRLIAA
jgi:hypothetical protein